MWNVFVGQKSIAFNPIHYAQLSSRFMEGNSLNNREEVAKEHGFHTKEAECSHTFFFIHEGLEYTVKLQYKYACHRLIRKNSRVPKHNPESNKLLQKVREDNELDRKIWNFIWDLTKSMS